MYSSMQLIGNSARAADRGRELPAAAGLHGEVILMFEHGGLGVHYDKGNISVVRFNAVDIK